MTIRFHRPGKARLQPFNRLTQRATNRQNSLAPTRTPKVLVRTYMHTYNPAPSMQGQARTCVRTYPCTYPCTRAELRWNVPYVVTYVCTPVVPIEVPMKYVRTCMHTCPPSPRFFSRRLRAYLSVHTTCQCTYPSLWFSPACTCRTPGHRLGRTLHDLVRWTSC